MENDKSLDYDSGTFRMVQINLDNIENIEFVYSFTQIFTLDNLSKVKEFKVNPIYN